jgi:hypothetical protein
MKLIQTLFVFIVDIYCPPWLLYKSLQLLNFDFDADADRSQLFTLDPASQNDADPGPYEGLLSHMRSPSHPGRRTSTLKKFIF